MSDALSLTVATAMFAFSVAYVWVAFRFPLELEVREGTGWLHVLAKRVGVDIYDPRQVAFVNMNHGPFDSLLKSWVANCFPFFSSAMVTRFFVLLLPVVLLVAAYVVCRKRWSMALFAAATVHLLMAGLSPMFVVGRTDAIALCGTALSFAVAHLLISPPAARTPLSIDLRLQTLLGALSAFVLLTTWRFLPCVGSVVLLVVTKQLGRPRRMSRKKLVSCSLGPLIVGFLLVFESTFYLELHGNIFMVYKRFFGFFTGKSGWGIFPEAGAWQVIPDDLSAGRGSLLVLALGLTLVCLYRLRDDKLEVACWLAMLLAMWLSCSYAYHRNYGGAGVYYFYPSFMLTWFLAVHVLGDPREAYPRVRLALCAGFAALVPWQELLALRAKIVEMTPAAVAFLEEVDKRAAIAPVLSEDVHLFRTRYQGAKVDSGDVAYAIATSGYFGKPFTHTFEQYQAALAADPPRFVVTALYDENTLFGNVTPGLDEILHTPYNLVAKSPPCLIANDGEFIALLERPW